MNGVLQAAGASDIEALLRFMGAYAEFDGLQFAEVLARRAMAQLLGNAGLGRAWFIRGDDRRCGYVTLCHGFSLELGGRDAFIDELYIEPSFRNRGLGTQALQGVSEAARADGVRALHLEVRRDNPDAQRYYERLGFTRRDRYFIMTQRL